MIMGKKGKREKGEEVFLSQPPFRLFPLIFDPGPLPHQTSGNKIHHLMAVFF